MKLTQSLRTLPILFAAALFAGMSLVATAQGWKPDRPVELIVDCTPGCGPDSMVRLMQRVFQANRYVDAPISIQNKSGGANAIVRTYMKQFDGNGHYLYHAGQGVLGSHVIGRGAYTDLTPVAMLFGEHIGIAVKADSPIQSGRDLIERLRKDPSAHSFGLSAIGSTQHQAAALALKIAGVDIRKARNVTFNSGALARTALLGGHVDIVAATIGSLDPDIKTGALRVIALASAERLPGLYSNVPTWREQGANSVVFLWRAMFGPKGMTPAQVAYWESIFQRLTETPEWKAEMVKRSSVTLFMGAQALKKRMDEEYPEVKALLVDLELAKK
jgi:putative tricarboxylic transport membrane protein